MQNKPAASTGGSPSDARPVEDATTTPEAEAGSRGDGQNKRPREIDGPQGPDPTRYGDWERGGRCIDF